MTDWVSKKVLLMNEEAKISLDEEPHIPRRYSSVHDSIGFHSLSSFPSK